MKSIRKNRRSLSKAEKLLSSLRRYQNRALYGRNRRKNYLKQKNRYEFGKSNRERKHTRRQTKRKNKYYHVTAPSILSFVEDPSGIVNFIDEVRNCFENRIPVFVELKNVKSLGYDGLAVLLSAVVRFKASKIPLNGSTPKDPEVYRELEESKFFDYLYDEKFRDQDSYSLTSRDSIHTHAKRAVDSQLGEKLIQGASETIWGTSRRCPGAQRALIEQMQNTNNHASLDTEGDKHWWLSLHHDKEGRRVEFSFVDYGVGVFHNLENKREGSKFFRVIEQLRRRIEHGANDEILRLIFTGELHQTASGKPYRGKGLPGIYEAYATGKINSLFMVSNNVMFDSRSNSYQLLKKSFEGTFIHWELNETCFNLPWTVN